MKSMPTFDEEIKLWNTGHKYVVGIDEVGRGAFAGPVVVGAVIFSPFSKPIAGVNDSKLLSAKQREALVPQIIKSAHAYATAEISVTIINQIGIGKATQMAFRRVLKLLSVPWEYILMDAFYIKRVAKQKQKPIIKGDQKSVSIAAASIIAKVHRDNLMLQLHQKYPDYNFCENKGYGTLHHRNVIEKRGLCKLHRTSFNI